MEWNFDVRALVKARNLNLTPHDLLDRIKETSVDKRYNDPIRGEVRLKRVDALCAVTNDTSCPIQNTANSSGFEELK